MKITTSYFFLIFAWTRFYRDQQNRTFKKLVMHGSCMDDGVWMLTWGEKHSSRAEYGERKRDEGEKEWCCSVGRKKKRSVNSTPIFRLQMKARGKTSERLCRLGIVPA